MVSHTKSPARKRRVKALDGSGTFMPQLMAGECARCGEPLGRPGLDCLATSWGWLHHACMREEEFERWAARQGGEP